MKPTKEQIAAEIIALEACKTFIPRFTKFGENNFHNIDLQVEFLKGDIDITATDEWETYSEDEQNAILEAQRWVDGDDPATLSSGWDSHKK